MNRRFLLTLATVAVMAAPGCYTTRESCAPVSCYPPYTGPVPGEAPCDRCHRALFQPRPAPVPVAPAPAAPAISAFPPGVRPENFASAIQPGSYASSAFLDPFGRSSFDPGVRLAAPVAEGPDATPSYGAAAPLPPAAPPSPPTYNNLSSPLAVDVPQFAIAKDRVASGLQPFPDGIAWLYAHGYRTVLHVRAPGEDDSAARRQFEKRGLRYLSLEASPDTLSKAVVDEFDRVVTQENSLPLFVYDKDGAVAGGLWYLYFRTVEHASDERARSEAARLGLQPAEGGEQRTMWVAVQRYLSTNP